MIPKIIHYIWLGGNPLPKMYSDCMSTWAVYAKGFEVNLWDEEKYFEVFGTNKYVDEMLKKKKYAFATDYIRCQILSRFGGIYLDTDMELIKDITPLVNNVAFLGEEDIATPSCGILGCEPGFWLFEQLKDHVAEAKGLITIPVLLKRLLISQGIERDLAQPFSTVKDVTIYNADYFYPFNPYGKNKREQLLFLYITQDCYAIHHWAKSWKLSVPERIIKKIKNYIK
ncbi:hypothetical protein WG82_10505 [Citrobacter amalonaticus]|nr:hypothetical protein WG82_10505 [Citrobacter amalonaticus]